MARRFLFRVDGGPEIGYGHLVRTGALIEEVLADGHSVTVATTTPEHAADILPDSLSVRSLPSRGDPAPFVDLLADVAADLVFVDAYPVDTEYQRHVRERLPLAIIQDYAADAVCADLLINSNLYADEHAYEFVGAEPRTCLGPDYVIMRSAIRTYVGRDPPWREHPERALVTMGGSDVDDVTPTVVRAFDGLDLHVDVIVGPGFSDRQEAGIREAAAEVASDIRLHRDPDDLPERMFESDLAVCTASTTTYELLALGTPIVCFPVEDNQAPVADALRDREMVIELGPGPDRGAIRSAIERYLEDPALRKRHGSVGRTVVDGGGVLRVADALSSLLESGDR